MVYMWTGSIILSQIYWFDMGKKVYNLTLKSADNVIPPRAIFTFNRVDYK